VIVVDQQETRTARGWIGNGEVGRLLRSAMSGIFRRDVRNEQRPAIPAILLMARSTQGIDDAGADARVVRVTSFGQTMPPDDPERDRGLMRRIRSGDEEAFAAIYDLYAAQVNGVTLSVLRSPALAEEATHDVFLRLWQQPAAFDPARGTFAGWLLRVARNRAIDVLRRQREDSGNGPDGDVTSWIIDPAPGPEDEAIEHIRRQVVQEALGELQPEHRQLLELAYFTGLSQSQIAEHLGRPLGTVKSQIRAAMGRLADQLAASGEMMGEREGRA
jgi:RNA polymerase sigma-70 factor (ECF subfamily)